MSNAVCALGDIRNCCTSVVAMLGAVAVSVSVVFAGTSRLNAPVASVVACVSIDRSATVAPTSGTPATSTTRPVTVARSVLVVGVSGNVPTGWSAHAANTRRNGKMFLAVLLLLILQNPVGWMT